MLLSKKNITYLIFVPFLFILVTFSACKKKNLPLPTESVTDLIKKNSWVIEQFTALDKTIIQESKLNTSAKFLYELKFEFRNNNQVRAIVKANGQIANGGTWELTNNEKNVLIYIPGLKDEFLLVELTKSKLVLRPNEKVFPIVDNNTVVNMEFKPTL